jgi:hypothetical protein
LIALFTALELGGTWWYNRNNTSAHDDWLLSTPWSNDAEQRQHYSFDRYQQSLRAVINRPNITVVHGSHDSWWKDLVLPPNSINVALEIPGLSLSSLVPPLTGDPSRARLSISAYVVRSSHYDKGPSSVHHTLVTDQVVDGVEVLVKSPLLLRLPRLVGDRGAPVASSEDILIHLQLEELGDQGQYIASQHTIRFSANSEGEYDPQRQDNRSQRAGFALIDPSLLPEVSNARP